jgi:hypothetical protein
MMEYWPPARRAYPPACKPYGLEAGSERMMEKPKTYELQVADCELVKELIPIITRNAQHVTRIVNRCHSARNPFKARTLSRVFRSPINP